MSSSMRACQGQIRFRLKQKRMRQLRKRGSSRDGVMRVSTTSPSTKVATNTTPISGAIQHTPAITPRVGIVSLDVYAFPAQCSWLQRTLPISLFRATACLWPTGCRWLTGCLGLTGHLRVLWQSVSISRTLLLTSPQKYNLTTFPRFWQASCLGMIASRTNPV